MCICPFILSGYFFFIFRVSILKIIKDNVNKHYIFDYLTAVTILQHPTTPELHLCFYSFITNLIIK